MEDIRKNILFKIEKILDEELGKAKFFEASSQKPNESISVLSTQSNTVEDEIEVTTASTPIKHHVPIDLTLTPVKKEGILFKIF